MRMPLPHQVPVLAWAKGRHRVGFFLKMRLGKTFVSIRWARPLLSSASLALVVAPTSVCPGWLEELQLEGIPATWLHGSSSDKRLKLERGMREGHRWFVVNPEGLRAAPDLFDVPWRVGLIDESTCISNPQAQLTKLFLKRFQPQYRAILSGEPAPEHDLQYFTQLQWLHGSFMGFNNYWKFREALWYQAGYEWCPKRTVRDRLAAEVAESCYVLSAEDAGIANKRVYETRFLALPPKMRGLYREVMDDFVCGDLSTKFVPVTQNWLAQIAGGCLPLEFRAGRPANFSPHKFAELERVLTQELHGEPACVFFRFNRELRQAAFRLREAGLKVGCFTGLTKPEVRARVIADFRGGRTRCLLAQGRAARFGLDFSRATAAIFFSNWWDWNTRSQLEARVLHPARKTPALILDIITSRTVDEAAMRSLREKKRNSTELLRRIHELTLEYYK